MNKTKQLACIALLFFLTGTMVFATGSRQPAASTGTPTLQIGMEWGGSVADFENNYLTKYLEKLHNIKLELYQLTGDIPTRITLLSVANDLPETLFAGQTTTALLDYGRNGFLISLNRYLEDPSKTPNFNRIPEADRRYMLNTGASADGNIYGFPNYDPDPWNETPYRMYIERSWLAKLGLQVPKTTDELRNVLIAFRDRDPNGNGRRDEIGVFGQYGSGSGGYGVNVIIPLINSFIYYNDSALALDSTGRNITTPVTEPGFRRALQYLSSLRVDGLLEPTLFTVDQNGFRALLNADTPVVGFTSAGSLSHWTNAGSNPNFLSIAPMIEPLSSPGFPGYTPHILSGVSQTSSITNKARDVDLAVRVVDSFYEYSMSIIKQFGEEGVDWTRDPAVVRGLSNAYTYLGVAPAVAWATLWDSWASASAGINLYWGAPTAATPRYFPEEMKTTRGYTYVSFDPNDPTTMANAVNYQIYLPRRPEYILPTLTYTLDDAITLAQPQSDIQTYLRRSIAEFVTGARDINSDTAWNAYTRELDNMGLQQWVRIAQATYNRQR